MRTLIVVEVYGICNGNLNLFDVSKAHILKQFVLHCVVYPLSLSIIFRIPTLRHADSDMVVVQQLDVIIACLLTATIRVMYECMRLYFPYTVKGHLKCL